MKMTKMKKRRFDFFVAKFSYLKQSWGVCAKKRAADLNGVRNGLQPPARDDTWGGQ